MTLSYSEVDDVAAATLSVRPVVLVAPASVSIARVVVRGRVDEPGHTFLDYYSHFIIKVVGYKSRLIL